MGTTSKLVVITTRKGGGGSQRLCSHQPDRAEIPEPRQVVDLPSYSGNLATRWGGSHPAYNLLLKKIDW